MSATAALAPDAALALGIASTALPFAHNREAEAERWLRVLRLHGHAGAVLQALGVGEQRLREDASDPELAPTEPVAGRDAVDLVTEDASHRAAGRDVACVTTADLLLAVMHVYGADFDRALRAHGTDRQELAERLAEHTPAG